MERDLAIATLKAHEGELKLLRHSYEDISAPVLWKLVREDLQELEQACRMERATVERDA